MPRRALTAVLITAVVLIAVGLALMAAVMAGAFGPFGHFPFGGPLAISPLAWTVMVVAMALGGIGLPALVAVPTLLLIRTTGPRS